MQLFLINVRGQPVQCAITTYFFRRTHFAVYGRIKTGFQKGYQGEKTFYWLQNKITLMWKSLKQPAVTWWLKDIKDTLQQIKCNAGGKNQTASSVYAQGSFEGTTEELWGCSAQLIVSSLAEVDVSILCLRCLFDYFVERWRERPWCSPLDFLLQIKAASFWSRTTLPQPHKSLQAHSFLLKFQLLIHLTSSLFSFRTLNLIFITL